MCPSAYVRVTGSAQAGLGGASFTAGTATNRQIADFCVMKYEARLQEGDALVADGNRNGGINLARNSAASDLTPTSTPTGKPWVRLAVKAEAVGTALSGADRVNDRNGLDPIDAVEACAFLGPSYQLMSNAQWQALARLIEQNPKNWQFNLVGGDSNNLINAGNAFAAVADPQPAAADSLGCTGVNATDATCGVSGWDRARRTHFLNNKGVEEVIWDVSGNVWEMLLPSPQVDRGDQTGPVSDESYIGTAPAPLARLELGPAGLYSNFGAPEYGLLGHFIEGGQGEAYARGGTMRDGNASGIFAAISFQLADQSPDQLTGFRCAYAP